MLKQNSLIELQRVAKWFGRGKEKAVVLDEISLSILKGEFLAIVGPSGSGKTTLTHVIGGLVVPDEGTVAVEGEMLKRKSDKLLSNYRNTKVGFVFQNFGLIAHYTALENVMMPMVVAGIAGKERRARAKAMLNAVGLHLRGQTRVSLLSGGERQRVSIARALVMRPDIIIADEPTGSLDSRRGNEVMAILKKLHKEQGVTILLVTHDQALASHADRVIHLLDGRIEKEVRRESK